MKASLRQTESYQRTNPYPVTLTPVLGGDMFWDNLNRLLGLGLHRFQWSET